MYLETATRLNECAWKFFAVTPKGTGLEIIFWKSFEYKENLYLKSLEDLRKRGKEREWDVCHYLLNQQLQQNIQSFSLVWKMVIVYHLHVLENGNPTKCNFWSFFCDNIIVIYKQLNCHQVFEKYDSINVFVFLVTGCCVVSLPFASHTRKLFCSSFAAF